MSWREDLKAGIHAHPVGFYYIFWGELAERASFYGMKCLLALYMLDVLGFTQHKSGPIVHVFTASCYLTPLAGGYIADRWLGKFRTIIYFAVPYILGHIILGTWDTNVALYVALFLLAGGSGTIKPNISPLMGMMYDKAGKPKQLRSQAFTWFYASINIGAASSMWTLPWVRDNWGYGTAFVFPTILMTISLVIFYMGRKHYPREEVYEFKPKKKSEISPEERRKDRQVLIGLAGIFTMLVFFWSVFDQASTTWTFFARDYMELYGLAPDMIQGVNPVLIVLMTPLFNLTWKKLGERGVVLTATRKMMIGFVLVVLCMATMTVAGLLAQTGEISAVCESRKVSVIWEIVAYVVITAAELCISVVGLEMAYAEAPARMNSQVTAVFLFTIFVGNLLAGVLSSIYPYMSAAGYFGMLTVMMTAVAVGFYFVARRYEARKTL